MASHFKRQLFLAILLLFHYTNWAQININLSIKPPFTPFISDYTNPSRLEDISLSMFNQSGNDVRLKFKFFLRNEAKGINISLKEEVQPIAPLELTVNEFRFVTLDDISKLYGKLSQNNFNIQGADIQNLILDGTIPDGIYEVCVQAYDFDAIGFTSPLSSSSPQGCFSFQVNYTDPPTDIRFNSQLLNYRFGAEVPKIGINSVAGQNYTVQFTPPAFAIGSSYEYELFVFEETAINPSIQQEASILQAIELLTPLINKTSIVHFFTITPGDAELDFKKNYYLLIRAIDLNQKALFKNKGYSTFKAFNMIDIAPVIFSAPSFEDFKLKDNVITKKDFDSTIQWKNDSANNLTTFARNIETRIIIRSVHKDFVFAGDVCTSNNGKLLLDTTLSNNLNLKKLFIMPAYMAKEQRDQTKWIIGVQHKVIPDRPFMSHVFFTNQGKAQCELEYNFSTQQTKLADYVLKQEYPLENDTLPFHYPPVVFQINNLTSPDKLIFTHFNSGLEPTESYKYLKTTTDADFNTQVNNLGMDTILNDVSRWLDEAANLQLSGESEDRAQSYIEIAKQILRENTSFSLVNITHALNAKSVPLGNSIDGKFALLNQVLKYHAGSQYLDASLNLDYPNISKILYLNPYKNGVLWTGRIGIYSTNPFDNGGISLQDYNAKFQSNSFTSDELKIEMLKTGLKTASGRFNVGMKTPKILGSEIGLISINTSGQIKADVTLKYLPSEKPLKLLPTKDNNDAWREFEYLSVAQQLNIEFSRDKNFDEVDTVITKRIIKQYKITEGESKIISDLYSEVSQLVVLNDTGKYFWRVTWSNVTLDDNSPETAKIYFRQLGNLLAADQLMGSDVPSDSIFFVRTNYKVSQIDSFQVSMLELSNKVVKPRFELVYPLQDDTIPFYYPPVVIRKNPVDSNYHFALTKFNSTVEPFLNHNYFIIDSANSNSIALKSLSFDTSLQRIQKIYDDLAREQLTTGSSADPTEHPEILSLFEGQKKKMHLQYYNLQNGELLPLGNNAIGKQKLGQLISNRYATLQNASYFDNAGNFETPSVKNLIYLEPTKKIDWSAQIAFYTSKGSPYTAVDSFEKMFSSQQLHFGSSISLENKQGLSFMTGSFFVGMKTPQINTRYKGNAVPKNQININFTPSQAPKKLIPNFENNDAWLNWQSLQVAQQWNIEVSESASFDTLVLVKSKAVIEEYAIPGSQGKIMQDLYSSHTEKLDLPAGKKYYYRITWSNPTAIDTNNQVHKNYFNTQTSFQAFDQENRNELEQDSLIAFRNLIRKNYSISVVDSFLVTDSTSVADTAVCGLECNFSMAGINTTPAVGHIAIGDVVSVGNFQMTIKTRLANTATKTYSGTGSIKSNLFLAPIAVSFTAIQFNNEKRLISGTIKAINKDDDLLNRLTAATETENSTFNKIKKAVVAQSKALVEANIDNETDSLIGEIYNYLNSPVCLVVDALSGNEVTMPFGLSKEVDNFPHTIAITDITFNPTSANFNAAAVLQFRAGFTNQYMGFGSEGLCLTPQGIGDMTSGGSLELLGSVEFIMAGFNKFKILGRELDTAGRFGNSGTQLVWDCKGFKHIDLKASLELDTSMVKPIANGKPIKNKKVVATGHAVISSITNWLLAVDFNTPFQINLIPGFSITCRQAAVDFSDFANPQGMVFPSNYVGDVSNHWKGLYFKDLGMQLPNVFNGKDTINALAINLQNGIIDETGVTLKVVESNILPIETGEFAGWSYSLDTLKLALVNSRVTNFGAAGKIGIPGLNGLMKYGMLFQPSRNFDSLFTNFSVTHDSGISIPAWFASLNLLPTSKIELKGDLLRPTTIKLNTNFNGNITIGADDIAGLKDVHFGTLPFEGLRISTHFNNLDSFKIKLDKLGGLDMNRVISNNTTPSGTITSSGTQKTGGFPIHINDFGLDAFVGRCNLDLDPNNPGVRIGIKFKLVVDVTELGPVKIGGSCVMGLYGTLENIDNKPQFAARGLNVDTILVNAALNGAVTINGGIIFMSSDPVYGNGVAGRVAVDIAKLLRIDGSIMFGEKNDLKYWMVGVEVGNLPPIPIDFSVGAIYANSISMEAWSKMNRIPGTAADVASTEIGRSPSGAKFFPSDTAFFGFGAALGLTGPPGTPLFGSIGLYAQINNAGGLGKLTMTGNLWMTENNKATAPVLVNANITLDIDRKQLVGDMTALVNVGNGAVRGRDTITTTSGTFYEAGNVALLIDSASNEWYIKIGNPFETNKRLGFGFYAGNEKLFEAGGYFMLGNKLPRSLPPMEPSLVDKLRKSGVQVPPSSNNSSSTGLAVLMGVDANIPEKRIELGLFYAGLSVHFAADGLLTQNAPTCSGRNGLDGWYMTGKAYGVVNGALGMHVDMPVYTGDLILAELNAGMIMDVGLMNPYFFTGNMAANYSVLGGLIEGSKRFTFKLKEDPNCADPVISNKFSYNSMVADLNPANNATDVLVGAEPTIAFNFAYKKEILLKIPDSMLVSGTYVRTFSEKKIRLTSKSIQLKNLRTNNLVKYNLVIGADSLEISLRPDSFLQDGRTNYEVTAHFVMQQWNQSTREWKDIIRVNNRVWDTLVKYKFTTENEATFQTDYVDFSTPLAGENFFKPLNGSSQIRGQIQCKTNNVEGTFFKGQLPASGALRSVALTNGYNKYYAQIVSIDNINDPTILAIRFQNNRILFDLPSTLEISKLYQIRIIKERVPGSGLINTGGNSFQAMGELNIRKRKASAQVDTRLIMYAFTFKTSKYRSIEEKVAQLSLGKPNQVFSASANLTISLSTDEPFELYEVSSFTPQTGSISTINPQIVFSNSILAADDNTWTKDFYRAKIINPGNTIRARATNLSGPFTDRSRQTAGVSIIQDQNIVQPMPNNSLRFSYDLRLTNSSLLRFNTDLNTALNSRSNMVATSGVVDNGLTVNPQTGTVSQSSSMPPPRTVENVNTTTAPPIGTVINLNYDYIPLLMDDFSELKTLASKIRNRRTPVPWFLGLTTAEIKLVEVINKSTYRFTLPSSSNEFTINLHKTNTSNSVIKNFKIYNSILPKGTTTPTKSTTSFTRF